MGRLGVGGVGGCAPFCRGENRARPQCSGVADWRPGGGTLSIRVMGHGTEREKPQLPEEPQQLVLELDGYEGPIDLLLTLASQRTVDHSKISLLALAHP